MDKEIEPSNLRKNISSKKIKIKKKKIFIVVNKEITALTNDFCKKLKINTLDDSEQGIDNITNTDSFNKWSNKSKDTPFKTTKKCPNLKNLTNFTILTSDKQDRQ